jgi:hypothetical protein
MSWEKADERVLSLEEVFLSREFGQVHHAQQEVGRPDPTSGSVTAAGGDAEPLVPLVPTAAIGHVASIPWSRSRVVGAASGIAASLFVALGLVTGTGRPDKPGGVKGALTGIQAAAPVVRAAPVGGTPAAPLSAVAHSTAPLVSPTADSAVLPSPAPQTVHLASTPAPVAVPAPAPSAGPPPPAAPPHGPPPTPGPPHGPTHGPPPSAGSPHGPNAVVTSVGNVVGGVVSNLGTTLPHLPPVGGSLSVTGVVSAHATPPVGAPLGGRAPSADRSHSRSW